jgi:DNA-binding response OmpR family regulator
LRALSAGADDYILKPFDRESIRLKLTSAGLKSRQHRFTMRRCR